MVTPNKQEWRQRTCSPQLQSLRSLVLGPGSSRSLAQGACHASQLQVLTHAWKTQEAGKGLPPPSSVADIYVLWRPSAEVALSDIQSLWSIVAVAFTF